MQLDVIVLIVIIVLLILYLITNSYSETFNIGDNSNTFTYDLDHLRKAPNRSQNSMIDSFERVDIPVKVVDIVPNPNQGPVPLTAIVNPYGMDHTLETQLKYLKDQNQQMQKRLTYLDNVVSKLYTYDVNGDFVVHGWFVQFHNVTTNSPDGVILTEMISKLYGVPIICFRAQDRYPFLGLPDKPIFFPKANNIGFRAMTLLKFPKTGWYDFKILNEDGMRVYYQPVTANVILNEKNMRSVWKLIINSWTDQAETWVYSNKMYFNQNDLIMVRLDYYALKHYAACCTRMRYYTDGENSTKFEESDLSGDKIFCSVLWPEVPLLGDP